jgi:hypothetical protein
VSNIKETVQNQINNIYEFNFSHSKIVFASFFIFLVGFINHFPLEKNIEKILRQTLLISNNCQVSFNSFSSSFLINYYLSDASIPSSCAPNVLKNSLSIEQLAIKFRGLSFSPFGPHFKIELKIAKQNLDLFVTPGLTGISVVIKEQKIKADELLSLISSYQIKGQFLASSKLILSHNGTLNDLQILISSKDFDLPVQNIMGFNTPELIIGDFLIKGKLKDQSLVMEEIILGNVDSSVRAHFKGVININQKSPNLSQIKMSGEVAFSEKVFEELALLKMALEQFNQKDNFYQIDINGSFASPNFSSPKL